jgi:hypothetical protein
MARSQANGQPVRAAFLKEAIWPPNAELKFGFLLDKSDSNLQIQAVPPNADPLAQVIVDMVKNAGSNPQAIKEAYKQAVIKVIQERFMPIINRKITFEDDVNNANIKVVFKSDLQSFAGVGSQVVSESLGEDLHFGWWEMGTILHEIGHVFGMIHEHQNPIGGQTLRWKKDLAVQYFSCQGWDQQMIEHNVFEKIDETTVNGSYFDPLSVMLYDYPACLTENGIATRRNPRFSAYDVMWIANNYGGKSVQQTQTAMGVLQEIKQTQTAREFFNSIYPDSPTVDGKDAFDSNIALSDAERVKFGGPLPPDTKKCPTDCQSGEFCDYQTGKCVKLTGGGGGGPTNPKPTNPTTPFPTEPTSPFPTEPSNPTTGGGGDGGGGDGGGGDGGGMPGYPPCIGVSQCPVVCNSNKNISKNLINSYKSAYLPPVYVTPIKSQSLNSSSTSSILNAPQPKEVTVGGTLSRTIRLNNDESVPVFPVTDITTGLVSVSNLNNDINTKPKVMASRYYSNEILYDETAATSGPTTATNPPCKSNTNAIAIFGTLSIFTLLMLYIFAFKVNRRYK